MSADNGNTEAVEATYDARTQQILDDFGRSTEEKDRIVLEVLQTIEKLTGQHSVLALDVLVSALHLFIIHCAKAKTGLSPDAIRDSLKSVLDHYLESQAVLDYTKEINNLESGGEAQGLSVVHSSN